MLIFVTATAFSVVMFDLIKITAIPIPFDFQFDLLYYIHLYSPVGSSNIIKKTIQTNQKNIEKYTTIILRYANYEYGTLLKLLRTYFYKPCLNKSSNMCVHV